VCSLWKASWLRKLPSKQRWLQLEKMRHTANHGGCPVYKELKIHIHQTGTTAHTQNKQLTASRSNPEVLFSTSARSSLRPRNFDKNVTIVSALNRGCLHLSQKVNFYNQRIKSRTRLSIINCRSSQNATLKLWFPASNKALRSLCRLCAQPCNT